MTTGRSTRLGSSCSPARCSRWPAPPSRAAVSWRRVRWSPSRPRHRRTSASRREPTIVWSYMSPGEPPELSLGAPYPMPWLPESKPLLRILGIALAVAVVVTWRAARTRPAPALGSGLVVASVAYPLVWAGIHSNTVPIPYQLYNGAYPLLLSAVPLVLALALMRRAARTH